MSLLKLPMMERELSGKGCFLKQSNGVFVNHEESQTLSDQQVYRFLFASGFSTANKVTDISGRGVGLDVVRSKIESLGGSSRLIDA